MFLKYKNNDLSFQFLKNVLSSNVCGMWGVACMWRLEFNCVGSVLSSLHGCTVSEIVLKLLVFQVMCFYLLSLLLAQDHQ